MLQALGLEVQPPLSLETFFDDVVLKRASKIMGDALQQQPTVAERSAPIANETLNAAALSASAAESRKLIFG